MPEPIAQPAESAAIDDYLDRADAMLAALQRRAMQPLDPSLSQAEQIALLHATNRELCDTVALLAKLVLLTVDVADQQLTVVADTVNRHGYVLKQAGLIAGPVIPGTGSRIILPG